MYISFVLLLLALASLGLDFFWSWAGFLGIRLLLAGVGLLLAVNALPRRDLKLLRSQIAFAFASLSLSGIWMLVQIVPMQPLAHPFWQSASAALQSSFTGTISIDTGATLLSFSLLSLAATLFCLAATLALDRTRAEWILIALTVFAGLVLQSLLFGSIVPDSLGISVRQDIGDDVFTFASFTLILAMTAACFVFERFQTRFAREKAAFPKLLAREGACVFVFGVALTVLLQSPDRLVIFAALGGVCVPVILWLIRHLHLRPLASCVIVLALLFIGTFLVGSAYWRNSDALLAYSSAPESVIEFSHRMAVDAPAAGTGAGSWEALRPLYQSFDSLKDVSLASSAAVIAIELGRTAFWLIVAAICVQFVLLLQGALSRGRDFFYAAAGAGILYDILAGSFINTGFLSAANYVFASAILGLALAQSASRNS